jgi:hypothetical protein
MLTCCLLQLILAAKCVCVCVDELKSVGLRLWNA